MREADVLEVMRDRAASYQFPWTEGIFRDCLRVGYVCRVVDRGAPVSGYGVMSVGAGEAHISQPVRGARSYPLPRRSARRCSCCLIERARAAGMAEAFLEVRPSNTMAIRLYQSLGFEQVGMRRGYYQAVNGREDAAVLKLSLRAAPAPQIETKPEAHD